VIFLTNLFDNLPDPVVNPRGIPLSGFVSFTLSKVIFLSYYTIPDIKSDLIELMWHVHPGHVMKILTMPETGMPHLFCSVHNSNRTLLNSIY